MDRRHGNHLHVPIRHEYEDQLSDNEMMHHDLNEFNNERTQAQKDWQLPVLVRPDEPRVLEPVEEIEINLDHNDAVLYRVKEKDVNGSIKCGSIFKLSQIPHSMLPKGNNLPNDEARNTFNLFMGDVSMSMDSYWSSVVSSWETHILPILVGRTQIMTFGSKVESKRSGYTEDCKVIMYSDFENGTTDLTGALQTIVEEVYKCKEKFINVFFLTDGGHNQTNCQPGDSIEKMKAPDGKVCNVYVLGAGKDFPVQYSVKIRSRLHTGSANLPTIFWAKREPNEQTDDMEQQMKNIATYLGQTGEYKSIKLSIPGKIIPYHSSQNSFYLNEYVYFDEVPEKIQGMTLEVSNWKGKIYLDHMDADVGILLNDIFRQWNGILIQIHNKNEKIPSDIIPFMERIFNAAIHDIKNEMDVTIQSRLASKRYKEYEVKFKAIINKIRKILANECFSSDSELAENILSTTVTPKKYKEKMLKMKGHATEDYEKDIKEFQIVIKEERENLMEINVTDSCSITLTSTISDLQDQDLNDLLELEKHEFLKTFTMSGIAIVSPTKECAMINPWIYRICKVLKSPYDIVSQVALENTIANNPKSFDKQNGGVRLQENDEESYVNAIIPVFTPEVAPKMKKIMKTKIYAMCCTFSILKNPHIIDYTIHMAALGVTWVRLLYENLDQPISEYVQYRMQCIEATAAQYCDRSSLTKYRKLLKENTNQALMTECTESDDTGTSFKCESLVKPMFILHLAVQADQIRDIELKKNIVEKILIEYIGRWLSKKLRMDRNSENRAKYSEFFTDSVIDQHNGRHDETKYLEKMQNKIAGNAGNLLEVFYYKEECRKAAKKAAKDIIQLHTYELTHDVQIKLNVEKDHQMRNVSTCGDISLRTLRAFAKEVGLSEYYVEELFSEENIFLYVAHAFEYTRSKERLEKALPEYNSCLEKISTKVKRELTKETNEELYGKLVNMMVDSWQQTYDKAHVSIVEPMTQDQIIQEANKRGVIVNEENFEQIYKRYRPQVGLLGNACQSQSCPWFLKPKKTFSAHISTDRCNKVFPHSLHFTTKCHCRDDVRTIKNKIVAGKCKAKESYNLTLTTHEQIAELELNNLKNAYMQTPILACKICNNEMIYR